MARKKIVFVIVEGPSGAYAPDTAVVEDPEAVKPIYSVTEIHTDNPDGIKYRNQKKRGNIDRLKSTGHSSDQGTDGRRSTERT